MGIEAFWNLATAQNIKPIVAGGLLLVASLVVVSVVLGAGKETVRGVITR